MVTKSILLDRICEDTPDCMENFLKVHVSSLRQKLKEVTEREYETLLNIKCDVYETWGPERLFSGSLFA